MRDRSYILDKSNFKILRLQSSDCSLTASTRSLYKNFNCLKAMLLSSSCSSFSGSKKSTPSAAQPAAATAARAAKEHGLQQFQQLSEQRME